MAVETPEMPDENGILEALNDARLVLQAKEHYVSVEGHQARLLTKLRRLHHYYAPRDGDHWPEDLQQRPGKIHMTAGYCKPAVDVDARLQALLPRITQEANGTDPEARLSAENAEKIMSRFLDVSNWDLWMADFTKIKCLYGFGVLKVFWNAKENRPDVIVLENPGNLRVGWGTSDFREMDWAIYEYAISPIEAMRRFPGLVIAPQKGGPPLVVKRGGDHADPLGQKSPTPLSRPQLTARPEAWEPSEYEGRQVPCWNYWFKDVKGGIWEAFIVGGALAQKPKLHTEFRDIPYIWVENQHEPGVPWGVATHEPIIDLQIELNRAISHAAQIIADEIDPSWQLVGENATSVPDGLVPRGGEILAAGDGNKIELIPKSVNFPPIIQLIEEFKDEFHDITGLPRILFGQSPGSQTTGRALAVQVEAAANRLDFKRRYLYQGLRDLLGDWAFMLEKRNPKSNGVGIGKAVGGFRRWKIVSPEITPKDVIESATNMINQVQAKVISLKTAREMLGYDSPIDEETLITEERSNVDLFPGDVQVKMAVLAAAQALQMQQQAMDAQGADAQGALANQEASAAPTGGQAMNDGAAMPASMSGTAAPAGGPAPGQGGLTATALVRPQASGQAQALNQLASQRRL